MLQRRRGAVILCQYMQRELNCARLEEIHSGPPSWKRFMLKIIMLQAVLNDWRWLNVVMTSRINNTKKKLGVCIQRMNTWSLSDATTKRQRKLTVLNQIIFLTDACTYIVIASPWKPEGKINDYASRATPVHWGCILPPANHMTNWL